MNFDKNKIMQIVTDVLGQEATGVYIDEDVVNRNLDYEDVPLLSQLGRDFFTIEGTDEYEVKYGMTKLCIYPLNKKINWVIKIPITGIYKEEYYNEEDNFDFTIDNENFKTTKLVGKAVGDFCNEEINIYEFFSVEAQEFLSLNTYIGDYNDIPIYIQEKAFSCDANGAFFSKFGYADSTISSVSNEIDYLCNLNDSFSEEDFLYNIILKVGIVSAARILKEFCELDDLHSGNYGFNYKGDAVIFDYLGYDRLYHYEFFDA